MGRTARCTFLVMGLLLLTAGCAARQWEKDGGESPPASKTTWPSHEPARTAGDSAEPAAAQADSFETDGESIYRLSGEESALFYSASEHFSPGWTCGLDNLLALEGAVYFTESGTYGDDVESWLFRIVRVDGAGRRVLKETTAVGYVQLAAYGDRLFYVQDGFDSQEIGWVFMDGSASDWLDTDAYAAQNGVYPYYNYAMLAVRDGVLYATIGFFTDTVGPDEIVEQTVRIGADLTVTRAE